jgi:xanthine dehydrogenase accessory factor
MAFVDALFDGTARLAGMLAKRARDIADLAPMMKCARAIPVTHDDFDQVIDAMRPDVLIDARMRKRRRPEAQLEFARLTIGLGPNFVAGENAHIAIETGWGDDLGRVIRTGSARPFEGEPQPIDGVARERYVYSPCAGLLRTERQIGDHVGAGECIAKVDAVALVAPIDGCIRGLTHDGVRVQRSTKVIEIDPRDDPALVFGLGKRPSVIAGGVIDALASLDVRESTIAARDADSRRGA